MFKSPIFSCFLGTIVFNGANPITGNTRWAFFATWHALRGRCWSSSKQFLWKKVKMETMAPAASFDGQMGLSENSVYSHL